MNICSYIELIYSPISSNKLWRKGRQGQIYLSEQAEEWKANLQLDMILTRKKIEESLGYETSKLSGIIFNCLFYQKDNRSDTHNTFKLLADGLQLAFSLNDRHFIIREIDRLVIPKMKQSVILMQIIPIERNDKLRREKIWTLDLQPIDYIDRIMAMMEVE